MLSLLYIYIYIYIFYTHIICLNKCIAHTYINASWLSAKTYASDETSLSHGSTCRGRIVLAPEELKEQTCTNTSKIILAHGIV